MVAYFCESSAKVYKCIDPYFGSFHKCEQEINSNWSCYSNKILRCMMLILKLHEIRKLAQSYMVDIHFEWDIK